jgi:5-methylthioribose kinase
MPKLFRGWSVNNLIALEDLGSQMTILFCTIWNKKYKRELQQLVNYLNGLHQSFQKTVVDDELENRNAKAELWTYFEYPFREENGFDLDTVQEGLQAVAMPKKDPLKQKLSDWVHCICQKEVLQGDYYPGVG